MPMARISGDGGVEWLDHNLCNDAVKEALDTSLSWNRGARIGANRIANKSCRVTPSVLRRVLMQYMVRWLPLYRTQRMMWKISMN